MQSIYLDSSISYPTMSHLGSITIVNGVRTCRMPCKERQQRSVCIEIYKKYILGSSIN